jgi:hypothetical protein
LPLKLGNAETPSRYVTVLVTVVYIVEACSSELAAVLDGKLERTMVCVAKGVLPTMVVSTLINVFTPVISVRTVSTSSADGPWIVCAIVTCMSIVCVTVTFETAHVSMPSTQVVDAPSESAEHATASTVEGTAPDVNSDQGAT